MIQRDTETTENSSRNEEVPPEQDNSTICNKDRKKQSEYTKSKKRTRFICSSIIVSLIILSILIILFTKHFNSNSSAKKIPGICSAFSEHITPSTGNIIMPVFLIDFPDEHFQSFALSTTDLKSILFDQNNIGSMTTFEANASYNQLYVSGDLYYYTAKEPMQHYIDSGSFELLAMEVLNSFDDSLDYSDFDSDQDGYIDAFTLTVAGDNLFWYGCQAVWWDNTDFSIDGVRPYNYIMNDAQPYSGNEDYFVSELCHEFGHCMGLADYYKYDEAVDFEGMNGPAGTEKMDEMNGDLSLFSKCMLGWLNQSQVTIYNEGKKNYKLSSAQLTGNCIIIPRYESSFPCGEYFLIEYDTCDGNMIGCLTDKSAGIRILHVESEVMNDEYGTISFRYNGFSPFYDTSHEGIRILRLVNDGKPYLKAGSVITKDTSGFGWYDETGKETIDPGIRIDIGAIQDGEYEITITR